MKDVITNILTDAEARSSEAVEIMLIQEADIASPWSSLSDV